MNSFIDHVLFATTGHINHSMFWEMLTPPKEYAPPSGKILKAIESDFGSLDTLVSKFNTATAAVQGSGWGWLGYNKDLNKLVIATTANQDPLQSSTGLVPLLGIDVWEHAYVSFNIVIVNYFYQHMLLPQCPLHFTLSTNAVSPIQEPPP